MKEREYLLQLYEVYNKLLTEKEREYFEYYYFEDYSLQEIALNNDVSRSYVSKMINNVEDKLTLFEDSLKICERNNKIRNVISSLDNDIKNKIEQLL